MITQVQLAKELGVSQQAVSFALNGSGRLADATRQRILRGAERAGYRKNMASVAMQTGKTQAVGLLTRERLRSTVPHGLIKGASTWLDDHKHTLSLVTVSDSYLQDAESTPIVFREHRVDGCLVMFRKQAQGKLLPLLAASHMPWIWINENLETNAVYPDDEFLGQRGTELLLEAGCWKVAYVGPDREDGHYSEEDRLGGYQEAMRKAGLRSRRLSRGRDAALEILRNADRPDGVVCYGPDLADDYFAAAWKLDIRVPQELKILVIGDPGNAFGSTPYAVLRIPMFQAGVRAMAMLEQRVEGNLQDVPSEAVRHEQLDQGETLFPIA